MNGPDRTMSAEHRLIQQIHGFEFLTRRVQKHEDQLNRWRDGLQQALIQARLPEGLRADSALVSQLKGLRQLIEAKLSEWSSRMAERAPMKALSENFEDRAVLLVFGKVNAGKSSFANYFASRMADAGCAVHYFVLRDDRIEDVPEPFKVGATETTVEIQGVRIGDKLVLLDTPGLHSVQAVNGDLTRRFTDSADAILWLTSSTSPGQVQELRSLGSELSTHKPLVPVITKSDVEDEDEVEGRLVKTLRNKTDDNRRRQQEDVRQRALEYLRQQGLQDTPVGMPVSVSVRMARHEVTAAGFEAAGFGALFGAVETIMSDAHRNKASKASRQLLSYMKQVVLRSLDQDIAPRIEEIHASATAAVVGMRAQQDAIAVHAVAEVISELAGLLEAHKDSRDIKALSSALSTLAKQRVESNVQRALSDYTGRLNAAIADLAVDVGYEDRSVEIQVSSGRAKRTALSAALGLAGGALGAMFGGPFGAMAASTVAGLVGDVGGRYFEGTRTERVAVGVAYDRLYSELESKVRSNVPQAVRACVEECVASIQPIADDMQKLAQIIAESKLRLLDIEKSIIDEPV